MPPRPHILLVDDEPAIAEVAEYALREHGFEVRLAADGDTARDFASRVNVGMVGINFPIPVPLSYFSFGGWKKSAFGDLNQYGPDAFRFYTKTKTVTARWFSGIKHGAAPNPKPLDSLPAPS